MAVPQKRRIQQTTGGGFKPGGGGFNKGGFRGRFTPRKEAEHRINHLIRVPQVRLVGENVEVGSLSTQEALKMAQEQGLDLVEISPTVDPPVCKIIDYNKFLYDKKKKEKEMKAKSKVSEVKEIRFTPNTDDHDFDFKAKHAENFLKDGNKVKAYVQFKGRAIQFQERGQLLFLKFAERLGRSRRTWKVCRKWKAGECWPCLHQKERRRDDKYSAIKHCAIAFFIIGYKNINILHLHENNKIPPVFGLICFGF